MRLAGIGFTEKGKSLLQNIKSKLCHDTLDCFAIHTETNDERWVSDVNSFAQIGFEQYEGLIFVGACGIAVRAIAPFLKNKRVDPAVLVVDEMGNYVIPVLSGHLGGANALSKKVASLISATEVITTATDLNQVFAVDVWSKQQGLIILTPNVIRSVSSNVLHDKEVGFCSDFPYVGKLPKLLKEKGEHPVGVCISIKEKYPFETTLLCVPKILTIGIGCRKGIAKELLADMVNEILTQENIPIQAIEQVCSIDMKENEPAICSFCETNQLPFVCFSADQLKVVSGEFSGSKFVAQTVGVDNVCERAAVLGSGGRLIRSKTAKNGVTVAVAMREFELKFE